MNLVRLAFAGLALRQLLSKGGPVSRFERSVWWDVGSVRTRQIDVRATLQAWGMNRVFLWGGESWGHGFTQADLARFIADCHAAGCDVWITTWPKKVDGRVQINPAGIDLAPFAGVQLDVEDNPAWRPLISAADAETMAQQCRATGKPWSVTIHSGRLHPELIRRTAEVYVQAYSFADDSEQRVGAYGPSQFSARSVGRVRELAPQARVVAGLAAWAQAGYVDLGLYPTPEAAMTAAYQCALTARPAGVCWWCARHALNNGYAPRAFASTRALV